MLYERQKRLLALVDATGSEVGNLDFQKLLFLYCVDVEDEPSYEFVPYKYGGFSFTSYADKRRLSERGFLSEEERVWRLTPSGREAITIAKPVQEQIASFARRYANLRGDALVKEAYRQHPYYAIRSEIAGRILAHDASALTAIDKAKPTPLCPGIGTIGYEGLSLEGYMNRLIRAGVTLLCDVRRNPLSRRYGFSKSTLASACDGLGITYVHLPELGIASEERRNLTTLADYAALFFEYLSTTLPEQGAALTSIYQYVQAGHFVALTCYEADPQRCHRQCVADELARRHRSLTLHHI